MIDVDTRVSPTLHPAVFGESDEPCITHAVSQFTDAYKALAKLHDARAVARQSPLLTKDAATLKIAALADKTQLTVTKGMDSARKAIQFNIDAIHTELQKPLIDDGSRINAEIRAHVKAMPANQRMKFVEDAVEKRDEKTLRAVLGGPAYLSGLDAEAQAAWTQRANLKRDPERWDRLQRLEKAMQRVDAINLNLVLDQIEKGLGTDWATVQKLRAKQARLEQAFG